MVALAASGLTIVLLASFVSVFALAFSPTLRRATGTEALANRAYRPGDIVDLPQVAYEDSRLTVVVFGTYRCGATMRSVPYLKAVSTALRSLGDARMALVPPQDVSVHDLDFATSIGIDRQEVYSGLPMIFQVPVSPTVLVVDRRGVIQFLREGELDSQSMALLLGRVTDVLGSFATDSR